MILDRITINLPWPDPMLFPNRRRGSFRKFQPFIEAARQSGFYAARQALGRNIASLSDQVPVKITFAAPDRRRRDLDGMLGAIKHNLDGIAKALGVDDSRFVPVTLDRVLDKQKQGFVVVEIGGMI
ncbi:MAG TPA: hypothetical protein VFL96_01295 [Acidobacteriaceae bacterium]|nr:hypothetical protein [Acidobacteriaceae bacterium]